ncbi:MAG: sensor histidine kinase [Acidobacteria bacterium]|nr:sensor histidine kinase [Acidobacteriota bacterium]
MRWNTTDAARWGVIVALIAVISILHYTTSVAHQNLHEIYKHGYYVPIFLAAFWYGSRGGIAAASLTGAVYIYHIRRDWAAFPAHSFSQYAEIIVYYVVAVIVGLLSAAERRHRSKLETTSQELAAAYEKLQETFQHLRQADRLAALGQLSAGLAHEIRNPLGSIKGSLEILENEIPPAHPKREFVEILKEETARLNSIVAQFLKFARPPQPAIAPVSVNELIDSTVALLQEQARQVQVEIVKEQDPSLPLVPLDADQIRQVLLNIMLNGIQAMPQGGKLRVRSGRSSNSGCVEIGVSDNGHGIDEDCLKQIFDPFFTTKPQGTGLGLSICYQLVQSHSGRITARRNAGRGMTFCVEIPVESASSA